MKDKIVYLVGPMTGWPNANREAFFDAEKVLKSLGFKTVISPAHEPDGLDYEAYYMAIGFLRVDTADMLIAIDRFWESPGAMREIMRALELGKMVYVLTNAKLIDLNLATLLSILASQTNSIDGVFPLFWFEGENGAYAIHLSIDFAGQNYDVNVPFKRNADAVFAVYPASIECFKKWNAMVNDAK